MIAAQAGHLLLSPRWPTAVLVIAAAAGFAGWVMLYRVGRPARAAGLAGLLRNFSSLGLLVLRMALGFAGIWLALQVLGRIFLLATHWPLWPLAAGGALLAEALIWLYALERRVVSRRMGLLLTGLRLGLLGLLVLMLTQPVRVWVSGQTRKRTVAVLVDTSASMQIADRQLLPHERLRLAEALSVPAARRPYRFEAQARRLRGAREELLEELKWLDALAGSSNQQLSETLGRRRKDLNDRLTSVHKAVGGQIAPVEAALEETKALSQQWRAALLDAKATLSRNVLAGLQQAAEWTGRDRARDLPANLNRLRDALRRAAAALGEAAPTIQRAGQELDSLLYQQLGGEDRAAVDAVSALSRLQLAKAVLLHKPTGPENDQPGDSLLERLEKDYHVKVYSFDGALAEVDVKSWQAPAVPAEAPPAPATAPGGRRDPEFSDEELQTDLAGAMAKLLAELGKQDLGGIIVLSDGQDNGKGKLEPLARQLGGLGGAFCAAAMGAEKPPTDAAIIAVESPDTIYKDDRMYVSADVKLDGLDGREAAVMLYDGDRVVDLRNVHVAGEVFRTRVQLADEPKKAGLHAYRLEVKPKAGKGDSQIEEVFVENNSCALTLSVTDDRTKLLMVEGRPRWEFRYLKNLFTGRDSTVRLQYLLAHPDRFYGQPEPATPVAASVSRPVGQEEATALPQTEEEWMKFDVIILGDLAPGDLAPKGQAKDDPEARRQAPTNVGAEKVMQTIRKFVTDRGGTLVLIAGPQAMPGEFAGTPLEELIPVQLPKDQAAARKAKAFQPPPQGFRIRITPEGSEHVILRQDVEPQKSQAAWQSVPPVFWRSGHTQATPAAMVLAYALDPDAPAWLTQAPPAAASAPESLARRRREYYRQHALIALAPYGLGKVMMLNFDHTWRLRYQVGDVRHHKFWGQVIRWATAAKLPAGTHLVKLGTDKTRYPPHSRPIVRAKILREDFSPVVTQQAAVKVLREGKCIARPPLRYQKDSPGLYSATLEELAPGSYRLELDCPEAARLLKEGDPKVIATEISVDPAAPEEQIELAANRNLLERLAGLSHNGLVVPPYEAASMLESLPAGKIVSQRPPEEFRLWDSWPLLAMFCLVVTAEWVLRKRAGLT